MGRKFLAVFFILTLQLSSTPVKAAERVKATNWEDQSIYYLMIDRFNDGDPKNNQEVDSIDSLAYHGGDFQGIIDKLDFLKDMGFTAISLSSIFKNTDRGYHGNWIVDYYKINEHFGTMTTFQKLVKEAHSRNLKVIIDFNANNVAREHPWVADPNKQNWFHPEQSNPVQPENSWVSGMPDLNQDNPEVKSYLMDAAKWWIKKTDIDGYRLNEANDVPISFWRDFAKAVKSEKSSIFLLGDVSAQQLEDLKKHQNAGFDGFVNNPASTELRKDFAAPDQALAKLFADWEKLRKNVKNPYLMGNYFDDPSTVRFTSDMVAAKQFPGARWKIALTYLFTAPGIPIVYYGSEIALNGGKVPDNQRQMNFRAETELIDYITKLGKLRNQYRSLSRGAMKLLYEKNGMVIYKRVYNGETAVIAINNTSQSQTAAVSSSLLADGKELRGLLDGDLIQSKNQQYSFILDRDKAEIYVLADKSGINIPLIAAIALVYIAFTIFIIIIIRKRKNKIN
ncbi:alpha-amylase family glycosyl hydrolase [Bacillota bacterium Lsc_1132]